MVITAASVASGTLQRPRSCTRVITLAASWQTIYAPNRDAGGSTKRNKGYNLSCKLVISNGCMASGTLEATRTCATAITGASTYLSCSPSCRIGSRPSTRSASTSAPVQARVTSDR